MEELLTKIGQLLFCLGLLIMGVGIVWSFYDEYKIKYNQRMKEQQSNLNGDEDNKI